MGGAGAVRLALALVAVSVASCSKPMGPGIAARVLGAARERGMMEPAGGMRLRGGWARGETKHRVKKCRVGPSQVNRPAKGGLRKPCSGDKKLSGVERMHGIDVVLAALREATPHSSMMLDHRYTVRRIGLRLHRFEDNRPFNMYQKGDVNMTLLKVAYRGLHHLIPPLLRAGADINYMGMPKTGLSAHLVGFTPLSAAAFSGRRKAFKMLMRKGADYKGCMKQAPEEGFWEAMIEAVEKRRIEQKKAEDIKSRPWIGANRRNPGKRKTRHAHGAMGGCR